MSKRYPQRGFTLIELIVAMAVFGILVTIAVPSFTSMMDSIRVKRAADAISAFMVNAKSEAIKRNTRVRVVFQSASGGASWCAGMTTANTCDCLATPNTCTLDGVDRVLTGSSYQNIVLNNPADGTVFAFSPNRGTVNSGNAQVQSDNGLQVRVVVTGTGRIRLCSPSGSGNIGGYAVCPAS
jgi:prepilin-type N-terminal cleavage/methylation domain-containing protein